MNILFINTVDLDANGISTFILNNALYLTNNNAVTIITPNIVNMTLKQKLYLNNICLIELPFRKKRPLKYFLKLIKIMKRERFDVVHVNGNSTTMSVELLASTLSSCKIRITHSHNTKTEHPLINKLLYPIFNWCVTDRFACSDKAGKWLYGDRKFTVIKNGIKLNRFLPLVDDRIKIRNKLNLSSTDILLGNVGGLNYQKNQELLIKLLPKLGDRYKLILIGKGPKEDTYIKLVQKYNLDNRVFMIGTVSNVEEYLSAMDIFLMPSRFEGFPYALVEAQASCLKCIVSEKITRSTNLTGNVEFINIDNPNKWINEINEVVDNNDYLFENRLKEIHRIQHKIELCGFNANKNVENLENKLLTIKNSK